jgi:hypothetical protein
LSGVFPGDQAIERWRARVGDALAEALEFLAAHDESPFSDGVLGEWMRELVTQRIEERHIPAIEVLLRKPDPHLVEAGLELATRALECLGCAERLEPSLAKVARDLRDEGWVLEALIELLRESHSEFPSVYRELANPRPAPRERRLSIHRNRYIDPERDLAVLLDERRRR